MKMPIIFFLLSILAFTDSPAIDTGSADYLFPIVENGRTGYINSQGEVVIKPIFIAAGEFSEGLAAARTHGTYGYIDRTGNFVIPPQFDYATAFSEGLAIVFQDGRPFYIDRTGRQAFTISAKSIDAFENGRAIIYTAGGKCGMIDAHGRLVIDTVFTSIGDFKEGLAVVRGSAMANEDDMDYSIAVIDSLGNFVIPFGKYYEISNLESGYFRVELPLEVEDEYGLYRATGFVDRKGKLLFAKSFGKLSGIKGDLRCGLAVVNLNKHWLGTEENVIRSGDWYEGFVNAAGEVVINDTTYRWVGDFTDNRAFVTLDNWRHRIIDTKGRMVGTQDFDEVRGGFQRGYALVSMEGKWGVIDTNANFVVAARFDDVDELGIIDDYFFFTDGDTDLIGIAKVDGSVLLEPTLRDFDRRGFTNGLLRCIIDNKESYINKTGAIVWQQLLTTVPASPIKLNIDFMNRGYCYAYDAPKSSTPPEFANFGGHAENENFPKKIDGWLDAPADSLSIQVISDPNAKFWEEYEGLKVYVVNSLKKDRYFNAQDGRLAMKVQALSPQGEWRDIEYLPSSWCGNSYHVLTLPARHYWEFTMPAYEGDFTTKLRIELTYIDPTTKRKALLEAKELILYSQEFAGSVNPGQFWRRPSYYPQGLMDPYDE